MRLRATLRQWLLQTRRALLAPVMSQAVDSERWIVDSVTCGAIETPPTFFGEDEIYAPCPEAIRGVSPTSQMFHHTMSQVVRRPYLLELEDAISAGGVVTTAHGRLVLECLRSHHSSVNAHNQFHLSDWLRCRTVRALGRRARTVEVGYFLNPFPNYFHFVVDSLLKLEVLRLQEIHPLDQVTLVASPGSLTPWQCEYLAALGYHEEDILFPGASPIRFRKLLVTSTRRSHFAYSRRSLEALRDRVLGHFGIRSNQLTTKLYISRRDAVHRRVLNEDELLEELTRRGFETITLEGMSLSDQVSRFAASSVIVAPHGAALTNLAFTTAPKLVELHPRDDYGRAFFMTMCLGLGGQYARVVGENCTPTSDYEIPVDHVLEALDGFR